MNGTLTLFKKSLVKSGLVFLLGILGCEKQKKEIKPELANDIISSQEGPLAMGCDGADYNNWKTSPYVLPFPVGNSYVVNLSHCSGSFHSPGEPDQFAIDFEMTIGSAITASREGVVVHVEESGIDGGFPNNVVVIRHNDNTYAQYMHLTHNGGLVYVGEQVKLGDVIGLSGNTGLAGYPHLHFVVTIDGYSYPYQSIPNTFKNTASNERSLASWTEYTALPYN